MESPGQKNDSHLRPTQQKAVEARGNVLVMAGAGTGKTTTLIARCLDCIERDGAALNELLIVTFTEAAAAKLRKDLRAALENKLKEKPNDFRYAEQLALFDNAHIGTLHSFCLKLVREHFYELKLDPRVAMVDEGEARQLANETLDEQFTEHYKGGNEFALAVQNLIQIHGSGRDEQIRKLVLRLHHHSQARPDAAGWLARQRMQFSSAEPVEWERWLQQAIENWRDDWLPVLQGLKPENEKAAELAGILSRLQNNYSREAAAEALGQIAVADVTVSYPKGKAGKLRPALGDIFNEAEFLHSLAVVKNGVDPLVEDWSWVRGQMETLLRLAEEFATKLAERKLADAVLDFHDLEQFALKLLWSFSTGQPTSVAVTWREKLQFVFVDEYQDINAAQDKIIAALSREGAEANRFLVGDVKQSIYRFRLAEPTIFRDYAQHWQGVAGQVIPLSENFRSRESLLNLVNSVFRLVMRPEIGGVEYDVDAELKHAGRQMDDDSSAPISSMPRAELLLRFKSGRNQSREDESAELANLDETQREARLVAWRLWQLVAERHEIFDGEKKIFRPVEWRDMAILLRSPRGRSEVFAKEFERAGVPLAVARGGFFESAEILDLLSLLQLLDNPLQDVPCIAVLRSPLVGLTLDELAEIRLTAREKHFWTALVRSQKPEVRSQKLEGENQGREKISKFLERFSRWRGMVKLVSLSQCLEEVLAETLYSDWLRAQPGGARRAANIAGLLQLAQQFDQFQQQGLFRFLKFIEAQQEADVEPEVPAMATENAVRLMSIHQSKGLEFPIVVLADLAKSFNERDLHSEIIFDEEFGLCPKIKPPHTGRRYPSLPHWLAQRRQRRELRGEELRLLYVALTRARENLILTASITEKSWEEKWLKPQPATVQKVATAKCFADWLALWFSNQVQSPRSKVQSQSEGVFGELRWRVVSDEELQGNLRDDEAQSQIGNFKLESGNELEPPHVGCCEDLEALRGRLEWSYPFTAATQRKAKSSVTALRREAEELDEEAEQVFPERRQVLRLKGGAGRRMLSAPEIGAAHHKFLQLVRLEKTDDLAGEAERLVRENYLSPDEHKVLDLEALAAFWNSPLGRKIQAHAEDVRRELPFTARFSPVELTKITGDEPGAGMEEEFVIVQGVSDLVVLRPREIWLVDFKTDEMAMNELPGKVKMYSPQLQLYAAAMEKIFARKVTIKALHFLAAGRTVEV